MALPRLTKPRTPEPTGPTGPRSPEKKRPPTKAEAALEGMYLSSRTILNSRGSMRDRHVRMTEAINSIIAGLDKMVRDGDVAALDELLSKAVVDDVHPEVLDTIVALTEEMGLESFPSFNDRVLGRIAKVDEVIKPIALRRSDGTLVTPDVRKTAREIYRARAKAFGEALRKDGNLDKFYRSKSGKKRERALMDGEVEVSVTMENGEIVVRRQ